ncbi:MAG: hypothetical protein K2J48_08100, partial [Muribaculaceae bacterium]|nr:hypothetical protein [Muribaculaceae bacterium]
MPIRKFIALAAIAAGCISIAYAQEALNFKVLQHSPIVNADSTATFILNAPKAEKVAIHGLTQQPLDMKRDSAGNWTLTTPVLPRQGCAGAGGLVCTWAAAAGGRGG